MLTIFQDSNGLPYLNDGERVFYVTDKFSKDVKRLNKLKDIYASRDIEDFYENMYKKSLDIMIAVYSEDNTTITQLCCFSDMLSKETVEYLGAMNIVCAMAQEHFKGDLKYLQVKLSYPDANIIGFDNKEFIEHIDKPENILYKEQIYFLQNDITKFVIYETANMVRRFKDESNDCK